MNRSDVEQGDHVRLIITALDHDHGFKIPTPLPILEGTASFECLMDLNTLVISTGRERTEPEYREILGSTGWRMT